MKTRGWLLALVLGLFSGQHANAFYNPSAGRWLNRDPIAEDGGKNLSGFVKNCPTQFIDPLGQYPTTSFYICWPKCNGKTYNPLVECCCNGKVVSTTAIDTGVVRHQWNDTANGGGNVHVWLTWDGGSADSNSDSMVLTPGSQKVESPAGATPSPNTSKRLKLSPCAYDFKKLNACMTRKAAELNGSRGGDCRDFATKLFDDCKAESRGCTSPP